MPPLTDAPRRSSTRRTLMHRREFLTIGAGLATALAAGSPLAAADTLPPVQHDHPRTEASLVRLLRQARVRSDRPLRASGWKSTSNIARPRPTMSIRVGMVDLHDGDRWIELGTSSAWCWQQGCMLQWIPGSRNTVLWNDREDGAVRLPDPRCARRGRQRTIPHPIYALSPDGRTAISPTSAGSAIVRPGYGYNGIPDPNAGIPLPDDTGIFRIDLETGEQELLSYGRATSPASARSCRRCTMRQALVQSPAVQPRRLAVRLPAPLAGRQGRAKRGCSPPIPTAATCASSMPTA